jgi:hypothetical protein
VGYQIRLEAKGGPRTRPVTPSCPACDRSCALHAIAHVPCMRSLMCPACDRSYALHAIAHMPCMRSLICLACDRSYALHAIAHMLCMLSLMCPACDRSYALHAIAPPASITCAQQMSLLRRVCRSNRHVAAKPFVSGLSLVVVGGGWWWLVVRWLDLFVVVVTCC